MISFSAMEEGDYGLKYKSSPEKFSYVLLGESMENLEDRGSRI